MAKYYRPSFNTTLDEYEKRLAKQGGVCKICGRPPGKNRLSIDHDHEADRAKIKVIKTKGTFYALGVYLFQGFEAYGDSREIVRTLVRRQMRKAAIRGLICFPCNGGIKHFEDSKAPLRPAERFYAAARYFREFENGQS